MTKAQPPKLLVIVGETASGKTDLALRLAEQFNGEIICADSATVRRGANIGTAKPTAEEQAKIRHHLLDLVAADEPFSVAQFKQLAQQVIDNIAARQKLPILVGGTGLYVDSVLYDYKFLPPADQAMHRRLDNMSLAELQAEAKTRQLDTGRIDIQNKRRLIRLLETNGHKSSRRRLRRNTLLVGLQPERTQLKSRIERRVDTMLADGLEAEARGLIERYGASCEAMKAIAYAQWQGYFAGEKDLEAVRHDIIRANLDYAKRQRTWFRRNKSIHWLKTPVNWPALRTLVTDFLSSNLPD